MGDGIMTHLFSFDGDWAYYHLVVWLFSKMNNIMFPANKTRKPLQDENNASHEDDISSSLNLLYCFLFFCCVWGGVYQTQERVFSVKLTWFL